MSDDRLREALAEIANEACEQYFGDDSPALFVVIHAAVHRAAELERRRWARAGREREVGHGTAS